MNKCGFRLTRDRFKAILERNRKLQTSIKSKKKEEGDGVPSSFLRSLIRYKIKNLMEGAFGLRNRRPAYLLAAYSITPQKCDVNTQFKNFLRNFAFILTFLQV